MNQKEIEAFWDNVDKGDDCWKWKRSTSKAGYGQLWVGKKIKYAHRLSYELTNGIIPEGMYICHKCDNPICVKPDHLFLGTPSENALDMIKKGRANRLNPAKGTKNGNGKLTDKQVMKIRKLRRDGMIFKEIARIFNVSATHICDIVNNKVRTF